MTTPTTPAPERGRPRGFDADVALDRAIEVFWQHGYDGPYAREALEQPTAYQVIERFLRSNAEALTRPDRPAGCLSIQGGLAGSSGNEQISRFLAQSRRGG